MRVLHLLCVPVVVVGISTVWAQETDRPRAESRPWWLAEPSQSARESEKPNTDQRPADRKSDRADAPLNRDRPRPQTRQDLQQKMEIRREPGEPPRVTVIAPAEALHAAGRPESRERLVYRLSSMPAVDAVAIVTKLLEGERAAQHPAGSVENTVVLADPITNSAVISGTPDEIHAVTKLLDQLDRAPKMVCVDVVMAAVKLAEGETLLKSDDGGLRLTASSQEVAELIDRLSKSEGVEILSRPRVMTLDNQPAFIQIGQRVPRVVARGAKEGQVFDTQLENVGLILGLTPRISDENVVAMEIDVEKSQLAPESEGIPIGADADGNVIRSPRIEVLTAQTTLRVASGNAVVLSGLASEEGGQKVELLLIVTPHVVEAEK